MTRQHKPFEILKSVTGGPLVGLGLHILLGNISRATTQLSHSLGADTGEALGILPSTVLAASQASRAYTLDHMGLLHGLFQVLVSFWPLLLVVLGAILLRDVFTNKAEALPASTKYFQNSGTVCRFCCPSFDV